MEDAVARVAVVLSALRSFARDAANVSRLDGRDFERFYWEGYSDALHLAASCLKQAKQDDEDYPINQEAT